MPKEYIIKIAGILPDRKEINPTEEKVMHLFSQLSKKDKDLVADFIQPF